MKTQIILSTADVASFFGVTDRNVRLWVENGCPRLKRGQFDLKAVFDWWWENIAQDRAMAEAGDESLQEQRRLYWQAKAERERLAVEREKGELIPRSEIAGEWAGRMAEVANGLQSLALRLPPLIQGKDQREARSIIAQDVRKILENYSRKGRFCHPGDMPKRRKKQTKAAKNLSDDS